MVSRAIVVGASTLADDGRDGGGRRLPCVVVPPVRVRHGSGEERREKAKEGSFFFF